MTTRTLTRAAAPAVLDLDARLALTEAAMSVRLDEAAVAFEVRTAHLPAADPISHIDAVPAVTPAVASCPYTTPIAATLHRARLRLEAGGWCTGALRDEQGAACLLGAIRAEAGSRGQADDAAAVLLEAIRRDFPDAESVPAWNDRRATTWLAGRYLDRAAELAHARGL
jgi:hypothetical protein